MAVEELSGCSYKGEQAESALNLLLQARPAPELLEDGSWREPLEAAASQVAPGSRLGALARRVLSRWCRLAGDEVGKPAAAPAAASSSPAAAAAEVESRALLE